MRKLISVPASELEGAALNYAVQQVERYVEGRTFARDFVGGDDFARLVQEYKINLTCVGIETGWRALSFIGGRGVWSCGPTAAIAVCRAIARCHQMRHDYPIMVPVDLLPEGSPWLT